MRTKANQDPAEDQFAVTIGRVGVDYGVRYRQVSHGTAVFTTYNMPASSDTRGGEASGFLRILAGGSRHHIQPSSVVLDFGDAPVLLQPAAESLLSRLPWKALAQLLAAIRRWGASVAVENVTITLDRDREATNWEQLVIGITLRTDASTALAAWEQLASEVDAAKESMDSADLRVLNRHVALRLDW